MGDNLERDSRNVAEKTALARFRKKGIGFHRNVELLAGSLSRQGRTKNQPVRMRVNAGMQALVGPADNRKARHDGRVDPAMAAGPVRMLSEETDASRNENIESTFTHLLSLLSASS